MPINFTNSSASISNTEYSLVGATTSGVPLSNTTSGIYQLFIDLSGLASGDKYRFRIYEKFDAAGSSRVVEEWIFSGVQSKPGFFSPSLLLGAGWDFTAIRLAGSDRTIMWSIRRIN